MRFNIIKGQYLQSLDDSFDYGCKIYRGVEFHGREVSWYNDELTFGHLLCMISDLESENNELKDKIHSLGEKLDDLKEEVELLRYE